MSTRSTFDELTATWEPKLRRAFLDAVADIISNVKINNLVEYIERGQIEMALQAVGIDALDFRMLDFNLMQTFAAAGNTFASEVPAMKMPTGNQLQFRFDLRNPMAEDWIKERSSNLVTSIVEDQRNAIRQNLFAGLMNGDNPRTTALGLVGKINPDTGKRQGGIIGLTTQQEAWQRNYGVELGSTDKDLLKSALERKLRDKRFDRAILNAIKTGEAIPAETREKMLVSYRNKSLKYRADTIARTETLTAVNQAQREAFLQAIAKGHVEEDQVKRFWLTARDDRVRKLHRLMPLANKEGVGMEEPFKIPGGGTIMEPPFGPNCRCMVRISINYFKGLK